MSEARTWAVMGALCLLAGGVLLVADVGLALRLFGLFVLAQGAKALRVGVELQAGGDPTGRSRLARILMVTMAVLVTLLVARVMGTWR